MFRDVKVARFGGRCQTRSVTKLNYYSLCTEEAQSTQSLFSGKMGKGHSLTSRNFGTVWPFLIEVLCSAVRIETLCPFISIFWPWDPFFCLCFSPQVILWSYSTAQLSVYTSPSPPPGVLCIPRIPMSSRTCIRTWGITTVAPTSTWRRCSTNSGPGSWKSSSPRRTSQAS